MHKEDAFMIYEKNLEALKLRRGDIYEYMVSHEDECDNGIIKIEQAKNGEPIIIYNIDGSDVTLNSTYNPSKEAERFLKDEVSMPDESILTMFGISNGSFAREFITKNTKTATCLIYEPSVDLFVRVMHNIDISDIIMSDKVLIVVKGVNDELFNYSLSKLVQIHNVKTNKHIALPKYGEIFGKELTEIVNTLNEQYDRITAESNTVTTYGRKTCVNSIFNMRFLRGCRSGRDYVGHFPEDMPVIIVSAGPSLEKNIDLLKEAKGKALILAVDTALPKVLRRGIKPDLTISVDYSKGWHHFTLEGTNEIPFIADIDTNYDILNLVKPKHVIFDSADSLVWSELFQRVGSDIWQIDEGGSVSTAAIAHMMAWGFKRIILVGQDLALTGNKVHADEGVSDVNNLKWDTTYVKDAEGNDILTRKDYCIYIRWIEDMAYKYSDIDIIDATEGGAFKRNTRVMTLREVIDTYCTKEYDVESLVLGTKRLFEGEEFGLVFDALKSMKSNFINLRKLLKEGAADCRKGSIMLSGGDFNVKELKRINTFIGKLDNKLMDSKEQIYLAKYVSNADVDFADDIFVEEEDDIKESIRMYNKSEEYYTKVADAIPDIIDIIDRCVDTLEQEISAAE